MKYYDIIETVLIDKHGIARLTRFDMDGLYHVDFSPSICHLDNDGVISVGTLEILVYLNQHKNFKCEIYREQQHKEGKFLREGPWVKHLAELMLKFTKKHNNVLPTDEQQLIDTFNQTLKSNKEKS